MDESTMQATETTQEQLAPEQSAAPATVDPAASGSIEPQEPEGGTLPEKPPAQQEQAQPAEDPAEMLSALTKRAAEAELKAAAALAGIPADKLPYALRMCDQAALCAQDADMTALAKEQIAAVLRDVPELMGHAGSLPGSLGDHKRTGAAPSAEDEARTIFSKYLK
ncbi:MAG: hypothetical protein Q4B32_05855 [Clostridia bacterium]|nr:hypothetical protein [Clostridia bacterium]